MRAAVTYSHAVACFPSVCLTCRRTKALTLVCIAAAHRLGARWAFHRLLRSSGPPWMDLAAQTR